MAYVVTDACIKCKYTDCVEVCPVDCFREGENMLVIDPDECISCNACVPMCPAEAIYMDEEVPAGKQQWIELNAELARDWPMISRKQDPLPGADEMKGVSPKDHLLSRNPGEGT